MRLFNNFCHSRSDQISRRKTYRQRKENACHNAKALSGILICIHSCHPAKKHGKQDGKEQDQNLFDDFELRTFTLLVFLENGGNGHYKAETEKENAE